MKDRSRLTKVFVGLLMLTVVTVGLSTLALSRKAAVAAALAVASIKAGLIIWHFMEVRRETAWVHAAMITGLAAVLILAAGLLPDVGGRW